MAKVIEANLERCLACKACVTACAMAHADSPGLAEALASATPLQPRIFVEPAGRLSAPMQCRHCQDAPCIPVCPKSAIARVGDDGPVLIDPDKCIGCTFCTFACPYGQIEMSRVGKLAIKCDLCAERAKAGEGPACVAACPTSALAHCQADEAPAGRRADVQRRVMDPLRAASGASEDGKAAACQDCGGPVGPSRLLKAIRQKLPERFPLACVCAKCRRLRLAAVLADLAQADGEATAPARCGSTTV